MNGFQRVLHRPFFIKLLHWEYWPFAAVYAPIYPVWFFLCARARSLFFFAAANPAMENGGFLNESKKDVAALIPREVQPRTIFFSVSAGADEVLRQLEMQGLKFPLIGKPDIGGRGRAVKMLPTPQEVRVYVSRVLLDFHIQEFVPYPREVGIFYYRYPGQAAGQLSGLVRKKFLSVRGDGASSLEDLMRKDERALLQLPWFRKSSPDILGKVLGDGEEMVLVPYGNHARGAEFLDDSHLICEQLRSTVDELCKRIPDFYFGRLDIRYLDWEDLKQGRNFAVIEVNGAGSEPTHMYDPRHSLLFAWKEIIRHWVILWRISRLNHRRGHPYLRFADGLRMFRKDRSNSKKLADMTT
jgi:hypothetical protein